MTDFVLKAHNWSFPYLDAITICGKDQEEHDANLECFLEAAERKNITYNEEKSVFSTRRLAILGSIVEEGEILPDPERLRSLRELPVPNSTKSLNRCKGLYILFTVDSWVLRQNEPINSSKTFPLSTEAVAAFESLKKSIEESVVTAIDENLPFEVETDASEVALAATLNQAGRPVEFFSWTLQGPEVRHPSVEKGAQVIIESICYWKHYLTGKHFSLKTDQKSVSYMFDQRHKGKIKNDKIMRWRVELSCYSFDIVYCPWKENVLPDAFSRSSCAVLSDSLYQLHQSLCHPGITTRMSRFVRVQNLPYSVEEIKRMTNACRICCEYKPRYHRPAKSHLIKATQPFERLNIDFKGPLPSNNKNVYFLNVIDEYSRFTFVFPCPDMNTSPVIKCLSLLFTLLGMPAFVHSDRRPSLVIHELHSYLTGKGVAVSRTTPYNSAGNGQVESIMELYGELSLWLVDPRIYPSNVGKMFFQMRSIPYDLFFVLLPVRLLTSASSVSPVVPRLDARFLLG